MRERNEPSACEKYELAWGTSACKVGANWLHLFDVIVRSDNTFSAMRERPSATCNSLFSGSKPRKQVFKGKLWCALIQKLIFVFEIIGLKSQKS
jgi:hypothetical protein